MSGCDVGEQATPIGQNNARPAFGTDASRPIRHAPIATKDWRIGKPL